jgi:hypothetical protein
MIIRKGTEFMDNIEFDKCACYSIAEYLKGEIEAGYVAEDGTPLKCHCGCTEFTNVNEYFCQYGREEYEQKCNNCGKIVGHWAYGYWQV